MTDPIDVDALPPTQNLMLELLAARHRLGHDAWPVPRKQRPIADQLAKLGLVNVDTHGAPNAISVALTEAGKAVMLRDGYIPPILQREDTPSQPLDLRALAVILDMGRRGAEQMRDAGLCQAFAFMAEQAVALHDGPSHIIGNVDEEFAALADRYSDRGETT